MRLIGDAVAHTKSADPKTIHDNILSPGFALGAFKGQGAYGARLEPAAASLILQPDDGRGTVSVSPQEGFLHQTS